jgi:hypothetical protein
MYSQLKTLTENFTSTSLDEVLAKVVEPLETKIYILVVSDIFNNFGI